MSFLRVTYSDDFFLSIFSILYVEINFKFIFKKFGINRCKLLYIGWMNNKVLLYSTENYIQYSVINHNGKEYEKIYTLKYIDMYNRITLYLKLNTIL